jgi:hypothetical protein
MTNLAQDGFVSKGGVRMFYRSLHAPAFICKNNKLMLAVHITSMVAITIASLIKGTLLLFNRKEIFKKFEAVTKKPNKVLTITGVLAGIYIVIFKFGSIVPMWLIIKLAILIAGGSLIGIARKRQQDHAHRRHDPPHPGHRAGQRENQFVFLLTRSQIAPAKNSSGFPTALRPAFVYFAARCNRTTTNTNSPA